MKIRNYQRTTSLVGPDEETLKWAVTAIVSRQMSLCQAAEAFGVKRSTLSDYQKKVDHLHGGIVPPVLNRV